jgi:hypothetical protein
MDLTEWVHVAAATVSYQYYILYYIEYNNDKKL